MFDFLKLLGPGIFLLLAVIKGVLFSASFYNTVTIQA